MSNLLFNSVLILQQNYMVGCSDVITGASQRCSDHCRNSLIALTSTDEGEALMKVLVNFFYF